MKVLVIKTSSLGDVIHTLPALTDALAVNPAIRFDWVVEKAFAEIPSWHPAVANVIPIALRRWRKQPLQAWRSGEWSQFLQQLRAAQYDFVLDAQGLVKSAFLTCFATGVRCGLDFHSARESLASLFYQRKYTVNFKQHAIIRARQLFAAVLGYPVPASEPDYHLNLSLLSSDEPAKKSVVFLHGTTWDTKHWPEIYWQELAHKVTQAGYQVKIPWGNTTELQRAEKIATASPAVEVLPKSNLVELAQILAQAKAVVAVDTGLGHLAAALRVPTLSLYGPTNPIFTGTAGVNQLHLTSQFSCAPCLGKTCTFKGERTLEPACFSMITPQKVWENLSKTLIS